MAQLDARLIRRAIAGAIVAPIVTMSVGAALLYLMMDDDKSYIGMLVLQGFVLVLGTSLLIGVPVYLSLVRRDRDSFPVCGLIGSVVGILAAWMLFGGELIALGAGFGTGALAGLAFSMAAGTRPVSGVEKPGAMSAK